MGRLGFATQFPPEPPFLGSGAPGPPDIGLGAGFRRTLLRLLAFASTFVPRTKPSDLITLAENTMIHELKNQRMSISAIARRTGLNHRKVRGQLAAGLRDPA